MARRIGLAAALAGGVFLGGAPVAAGSYGVSDGAVAGVVTDSAGQAVAGVFVVAQRVEGTPPVIRTTKTDAQGRYYLPVPTGGYLLGFSRQGFETVSASPDADREPLTPLGAEVRTFVEPGQTAMVSEVPLTRMPATTNGDARAFTRDGLTGQGVRHATIIIGSSVANGAGPDGRYRLRVRPNLDPETGQPGPVPVTIQADGYRLFQSELVVVGGGEQQVSFTLQPLLVSLQGRIQIDPGLDPASVEQIEIFVDGVPPEVSQGRVDPSGFYQVMVPASNAFQTRRLTLTFALRGAQVAMLTGVVAPRGGTGTVAQDVNLQAVRTDVSGSVVLSDGGLPQGGRITEAVLVELGVAAPILGGSFVFPGVPVGRALRVQVSVENPRTGAIEAGETTFTAAESTGGTFQLPAIVTSVVAGGGP